MTRAALIRPTDPAMSLSLGAKPAAEPNCGSLHDDVLRGDGNSSLADTSRSIPTATTAAGVGLLAMSVLSAFGYLVAVKGLVVPANAARTSTNVAGHEDLFGFGILSLYLVAALDAVVGWTLYRVFRPVSEGMSRLAASLRITYAAIFVGAISQLVRALHLHAQALHDINIFTNIWDAGLVVFGLHLLVLAYLAYRSGYVPKLLGVLLALAGFGYVLDSVVRVLVRGSSYDVSAITGMGEFVFALWLVTRGRRITVRDPKADDDSIGAAR
jgi:uncharacterized protein DUF4386